jgi:hypothetical protein
LHGSFSPSFEARNVAVQELPFQPSILDDEHDEGFEYAAEVHNDICPAKSWNLKSSRTTLSQSLDQRIHLAARIADLDDSTIDRACLAQVPSQGKIENQTPTSNRT